MEEYVLSIDSGTQSVRAIIFNKQGEIIASEKTRIEPYFSIKPGYAEQDTEYYWESLKQLHLNYYKTFRIRTR